MTQSHKIPVGRSLRVTLERDPTRGELALQWASGTNKAKVVADGTGSVADITGLSPGLDVITVTGPQGLEHQIPIEVTAPVIVIASAELL